MHARPVRDAHLVRQAGLTVTREHPGRGNVDHLGTTARLSGTPMRLGTPTPVPGGNTRGILQELGYAMAEIESYQVDQRPKRPNRQLDAVCGAALRIYQLD